MRQQFIEVAEMANSEVPGVADLVEIFSSESDNCCRLAVAPRRLVFRVALKSAWPGRKINDAHRTVTAWPVTAEPKSMAPEPRLVFSCRWQRRSSPDTGGWALKPSKIRARLETVIALLAGVLGIITIFWHDWIEALTGWDPDHHNGAFEWLIVAILLAVAVAMGLIARRHWRLLTAVSNE